MNSAEFSKQFEMPEAREKSIVHLSAAVLFTNREGKFLLLQQATKAKNYAWGLPAGKMKGSEHPLQIAFRECQEELGVGVDITSIIGIYIEQQPQKISCGFVFRGELLSHNFLLPADEILNLSWFSMSEIEKLKQQGKLYRPDYNFLAIKDAIRGQSFPLSLLHTIIQSL